MAADFVLRLSAPVMSGGSDRPLVELGLSAGATDIRYSWDKAGPAGMTLGVSVPGRAPVVGPLPEPIDAPLRAHAELWQGSTIVWEGFVRSRERGRGGSVTGLSLVGYSQSLSDNWLRATSPPPPSNVPLTIGSVLAVAINELAPWLRPGVVGEQWTDPGIVHPTGREQFSRMTPAQIIDQARQQGDSRGREVWVMCMPGRRAWVFPSVAPSEPRYRVAFDHRVQRWTESDEGMASTVTVEYGTGSSGTLSDTAVNATFQSARGFNPEVVLSVGNVGADAAVALRNMELAKRSSPRVSATLAAGSDPATWLADRHGVPVPYWLPRPGEWVGVAGEPLLPIVGVSVDASGGTATYELGEPDPWLPKNMNVLARDTVARYRAMIAARGGRVRS